MTQTTKNIPVRIRKYCASTERCAYDVRKKLSDWNYPEQDVDALIETLKQEDFVDDARYARSFASDQWRFQQWGRIKISHALWKKQIGESLIQKALDTIPGEEYLLMIHEALEKKWSELNLAPDAETGGKLLRFARQRGYEDEVVYAWLEEKGLMGTNNY